MQTKITFAGGRSALETFNHENMHQWWGDNVSEANYNLTFFKEGMATLGEYLFEARNAQTAAGGPARRGRRAFETEPRRHVQQRTTRTRAACGRRAPSEPAAVHALLGLDDLHPPGHRVHRAAPDPRPGELQRRAAADPARLPAGQHHRAAARGRRSRRSCRSADGACQARARPVLHPVVRHRLSDRAAARTGRRSPAPGSTEAASTANDAARTRAKETP